MITKGSFLVQPSLSRSRLLTLAFSLHLTFALPSPVRLAIVKTYRMRRRRRLHGYQILWRLWRWRVVKLAKAEKRIDTIVLLRRATRHPKAVNFLFFFSSHSTPHTSPGKRCCSNRSILALGALSSLFTPACLHPASSTLLRPFPRARGSNGLEEYKM